MAKFAAALMLEDVSLSFSLSHPLIIYKNPPVLLLALLIAWFRRLSVPSEHQRLKQIPNHYCLLTGQVGIPDVWLVWVTLWWLSLPSVIITFSSSSTLSSQCFTLRPFVIWLDTVKLIYIYMLMWASLSVVVTQIQLNPAVLTYSCWYRLHCIMGKCTYWHWEGRVFTFLIPLLAGYSEQTKAFMSCVALRLSEGGAALHFYPPVPAGMVGVLSLFSNAVFMATKNRGTSASTNHLAQVNGPLFKQRHGSFFGFL